MLYFVLYSKSCTPKLKSFQTIEERNRWLAPFLLTADGEDDYVILVFEGNVTHSNPNWIQVEK